MRWVVAMAALVLGVVVIGGAFEPPDPQVIRADPVRPTEDTPAARGKLLYERYGCQMCHGADAKGGFANPNAETDGKVPGVIYVKEGYTSAEVAEVIWNGKPRIARADPKGPDPPYRMPGWHDRMTRREVDDLVQYLMSLYPKTATEKWR